ncbi:hypothetical protein [Limosilactobacillus urinaemulieris]|uniref:hypothetical protein n=1 Tax=Limosilactobacillus urinaemulieris TaxID=2742600 RepID=UPI0028EC9A3E|nr:hypothetical protein [Limosilactobacillus urinaemulieris]
MDVDLQAIINSSRKIMAISKSQLDQLNKESNVVDQRVKESLERSYQTAANTLKIVNGLKDTQSMNEDAANPFTSPTTNSNHQQLTREEYRQSFNKDNQ